MKDHTHEHSTKKMATVFGISRSGYYAWLKRPDSDRKQFNTMLVERITSIQKKVRYGIGAVKMTDRLYQLGFLVNHKRISKLMAENKLNFRAKRRFKICTVKGKNDIYAPNILGRRFTVKMPNLVWVSDITYIRTQEGWLYLCVIIDFFSRKVVGYTAAETMSVDLVLSAFWKAVKIRCPKPGLLFHSDRGTQYCSKKFRNALRSQKMFQSMSKKGNCWDND